MTTNNEILYILGYNVKVRRKSRDLSQQSLAEKANVTPNTISVIETGKKFARISTLVNLANYFDTEVYEFFKPPNMIPDKTADAIAKYKQQIKEAVDNVEYFPEK